MEINSILVLFSCKTCNRSFRSVNKFLLHKQRHHNSEFQNAKCIVFEERITELGQPFDDVADTFLNTEFQQQQQQEPDPHSLTIRRQDSSPGPAIPSQIVNEKDTVVFEVIKQEPELYFYEGTNEKYPDDVDVDALKIRTLPVATSTRSSLTNVTDANCDPLEHLECDFAEFGTETRGLTPISNPSEPQIFETETDVKTETDPVPDPVSVSDTEATAETEWILGDEPVNSESEECAIEDDGASAMPSNPFSWTTHGDSGRGDSRPFTCPHQNCFKTFTSEIGWKGHLIEFHSAERPYACPHCGKAFSRKRNMERHIRTIHLLDIPFQFKCGFKGCNASFKRKARLLQHSKLHDPFRLVPHPDSDSAPKPFKCQLPACSFACRTQSGLSFHLNTHPMVMVTRPSMGPLPISFKIPQLQLHHRLPVKKLKTSPSGNTKSTVKDNSSKTSVSAVPRPRPHECPHCRQAFSRKRNMVRHINSLHSDVEAPFKCTVEGCSAAFKDKFKLASHVLLHDVYQ